MVESVRTGRSDMGIGLPTISLDRAQVVHFTAMIYPLEYGYASPMPKPKDPVYRVVSVFENTVWTLLILAFLTVCLTFLGIHYTYASSNLHKYRARSEPSSRMTLTYYYLKHERSSSDYFMTPLAVLTCQVAQIPFPRGASSCLTFLNWLLMAALISNFYRSTLLAHLVSVELNNPIQVTQDLLDYDKPMYVPNGSQLVSLFENSPNPAHVRVIAKTKENHHLYTLENGQLPLWVQDDIQSKSGAFVTFRQADLTNYVFSREIVYMARTGFMVHSAHTWKSDFDPILEVIKSSGLLSKFAQEFAVQPPRKDNTADNELVQPLAFEHVQGVFSVWIAGLGLAMVVFVLERFGRLYDCY
ncbi:uncharacterized protein LOC131880074 [Tigriopus californicus]|nr:uncharacterized protein LOC131880074 [Tigriopus californicus]